MSTRSGVTERGRPDSNRRMCTQVRQFNLERLSPSSFGVDQVDDSVSPYRIRLTGVFVSETVDNQPRPLTVERLSDTSSDLGHCVRPFTVELEIATRGSRSTLRALRDPGCVRKAIRSPSKPTHRGRCDARHRVAPWRGGHSSRQRTGCAPFLGASS